MSLRLFDTSLVRRMALLGILIMGGGSIVRYLMTTELLRGALQDTAADQQMSEAAFVAADLESKIRLRRGFLEQLARELGNTPQDTPVALQAWLEERQRLLPLFPLGLVLVPPDGHGVLVDAPPLVKRGQLDYDHMPWFIEARDRVHFVIGAAHIGRATGRPQINMATPVLDAHGQVSGVLMGYCDLDAAGLLDLVQQNRIGATGGFQLVAPAEQRYIAATRPEERLHALPAPGHDAFLDRILQGYRGTGSRTGALGEELVAVSAVPSTGWLVVAYEPSEEAYARINSVRGLVVVTGGAVGVLMILALVGSLYLSLRPMRRAAQAMHDMAAGVRPLERLPVMRRDEVGHMVEGFNALVDKLQSSEQRLARLAHCDSLTGLPNRRAFLDQGARALARARQGEHRLALLFIDLDGFKPINDLHGHEVGDRVLDELGRRLRECVRASDTIARFGGDEFTVLLEGVHDRPGVEQRAAELLARLGRTIQTAELELRVGASAGVAIFPDDGDTLDALLAQADSAMYRAKRAGPNQFRFA